MKIKYIYIFTLIFTLFNFNLLAQVSDSLNSHVIIAFDNALPPKYREILLQDKGVSSTIISVLKHGVNGKPLLKMGDYISMVSFILGNEDSQLDNLAKPIKDRYNNEIAWQEFNSYDSLFNQGDWANLVYWQGSNRTKGKPFSLITGAKAYSLKSLNQKNKGKLSNKSYLVMISDMQYNGNNDLNSEFKTMETTHMSRDEFSKKCCEVSRYFNFQLLNEKIISNKNTPYKVFLFEAIPSSSFSLGALLDYPASLNIKRVKGGYRMKFDVKHRNPHYLLKRLDLDVLLANGEKEIKTIDQEGTMEVFISSQYVNGNKINVTIRGWFFQNDSIYGGTVLSPFDKSKTSMTKDLEISDTIQINNEATIFGFPLYDNFWWWYPNDLSMATLTWEIIIVLIFLVIVIFLLKEYIKKKTTYIPNDKDIVIMHN